MVYSINTKNTEETQMTEKFLITSEEISRYSRKLFAEEKSKATAMQ